MNESVRMVVVLAIIAMVSAGILAQVYEVTSEVIEENAARALESSVYEVLPGSTAVNIVRVSPHDLVVDEPKEMREKEERTTLIYEGVDGEQIIGYAFVGEGNGYGGTVRVLVGVDQKTDQILNVKILDHAETPGLGSRIEEDGFRDQFKGKSVQDPLQLGEDIDSISGATVSSRAVSEAVRSGFDQASAAYKGGN
ncbi:MAG: RnfABCDGE type electron transport complex subunit G [Firmicutes bacterium]|nr:RnfABCDGE type electron transport complex subunit G [Bacillota bacterium]